MVWFSWVCFPLFSANTLVLVFSRDLARNQLGPSSSKEPYDLNGAYLLLLLPRHPVLLFLSTTFPLVSVAVLENDVVGFVRPDAPSPLRVHLFRIAVNIGTGSRGGRRVT